MTIQPRLSLVRTLKGKFRLDYDGEPIAGITNIDLFDGAGEPRAQMIVTIQSTSVNFVTEETPINGEQ